MGKGWELIGFEKKENIIQGSTYPLVLRFQGKSDKRCIYDLIMEFIVHVRSLDALDPTVAASKRLSVEGGGRLSDRRILQIMDLLRIVAVTNGRGSLKIPDLYIMVYCCWRTRAEWTDLSSWWLRRLKREMRSLGSNSKSDHSPQGHLWLTKGIIDELQVASNSTG